MLHGPATVRQPPTATASRAGQTLLAVSILLVLLMGLVSLVGEWASAHLRRTELRDLIEAGARSALVELERGGDPDAAIAAAQRVVNQSAATGSAVVLHADEVVFGNGLRTSSGGLRLQSHGPINALRISGHQQCEPALNPLWLTMRRLVGMPIRPHIAVAIAASIDGRVLSRVDLLEPPSANGAGPTPLGPTAVQPSTGDATSLIRMRPAP